MAGTHIVLMGVAGSGKTTVAEALDRKLGWPSGEADAFHPEANIEKMSRGVALTDQDRWPWLDRIVAWTAEHDADGHSTVVTCSALKRIYRDRLRTAPGTTVFVHLSGSEALLADRMAHRAGHFMPTSLLPSQFATLEPLEEDELGFAVDVTPGVDEIVRQILDGLAARGIAVGTNATEAATAALEANGVELNGAGRNGTELNGVELNNTTKPGEDA